MPMTTRMRKPKRAKKVALAWAAMKKRKRRGMPGFEVASLAGALAAAHIMRKKD
jgi:hypothetical protein